MKEAREGLGLWSAAALVVGHTIGVGIFLTPAEVIGALRSPAWTLGLWIVCGGLVLAGALTFGELAARHPESGGLYVYLREAWGDRAAFLFGWQCLLILDPGVTAALALGLAQYAGVLWPAAAESPRAVALSTVWLLALVNMAGLRLSARTLNVLTALKVAAIAGLVVAALATGAGSAANLTPFVARRSGGPPLAEAIGLALVGIFYSFGGFWEASRVSGELTEPRRQLPRALALGVTAVTFAYVATTLTFLCLVPAEQVSSAAELARRAGAAILGPEGPRVLSWVVVVSVAASALALVLMAPRLYLAMAADGIFPAALASTHPLTKAPVRATALLGAIASLYVLTGSFPKVVAFFMVPTLAFLALAASGLFVLRRRRPQEEPGGFRCPGYPATPALFVLLVVAVLVFLFFGRPLQAVAGFALVLAGLPLYGVVSGRRGRTP